MPMSGGESEAYFSSIQSEYDSLIRRAVPCYEPMLDALLAYLPENSRDVIELGCGTGNLTLRVMERYPEASVKSVDISQEMLSLTQERVEARGWSSRWHGECVSFERLSPPEASVDLVISTISLHHVQDKLDLFRGARSWLTPGGEFWFADQMWTAIDRNASYNWEHWKAYCREPGNCSEVELRGLVEHADAHDHYEPMMNYLRALEDAGFKRDSIDCVWRSTMWGIAGARR